MVLWVESFHDQYEYKQRVMKKKTIWTIAIIMGLSFLGLLLLQLNYIEEMAEMKKEQFDESVNRAPLSGISQHGVEWDSFVI